MSAFIVPLLSRQRRLRICACRRNQVCFAFRWCQPQARVVSNNGAPRLSFVSCTVRWPGRNAQQRGPKVVLVLLLEKSPHSLRTRRSIQPSARSGGRTLLKAHRAKAHHRCDRAYTGGSLHARRTMESKNLANQKLNAQLHSTALTPHQRTP